MAEEKKVVVAYTVFRNEDGSIDVKDAGVEGTTTLSSEEIYKDIEDVAKVIKNKRTENAAYVGAYNGVSRFFADMQKQQAEAAVGAPTEEVK